MPHYRGNERQDLMIPVCLQDQLVTGTIEHAIDWIIDHEIDVAGFDAGYADDDGGRPAYDPRALLKVILFAYSKGILSSRGIERACRTTVVFMALSAAVRSDHATGARFVSGRSAAIHCELASRCLTKCGTRRNLFVAETAAQTYGQRMRDKIDTPDARAMYSRRMGIVEPVFANITACKGMRRFTLRGRANIRIQWLYDALVHNIEKIARTGLIHSLAPA